MIFSIPVRYREAWAPDMDLMTIIGLLAGAATIYYVLVDGNILHLLINPVAFILVFGGTFSATLISYPWDVIKYVGPATKLMFISRRHSDEERQGLIEYLSGLADLARTEGLEALRPARAGDHFMDYGLQMLREGLEPEMLEENLEKRLLYEHQHNQKVSGVFRTMGTFSPIFGLLGTLIGVVQVLRNLSDPSSMGSAMAIAITTTFYGIFAANFLFLPTAIKLEEINQSETLRKQIIAEGIVCISQGDLPIMVRKKLNAFLISHLREHEGAR